MKSRLSLICALIFISSSFILRAALGHESDHDNKTIAESVLYLEEILRQEQSKLRIPGLAIAIVKGNDIIFAKGLGKRNVKENLPVDTQTVFPIASLTKGFTSAAAAIAKQDEVLSFDDALSRFIEGFSNTQVTLLDALANRSGLPSMDLILNAKGLPRSTIVECIASLDWRRSYPPVYQYQNLMFVVAGEMIARAEKAATYEDFVKSRLLLPLNMGHTTFDREDYLKSPNYAVGYESGIDGPLPIVPFDTTAASAAFGLYSNIDDMTKWVQFMLNRGRGQSTLIRASEFDLLFEERVKVPQGGHYGLGWHLRNWDTHKVVEHDGSIPGFSAKISLMPDQNIGFVILANTIAAGFLDFVTNSVWSNLIKHDDHDGPRKLEPKKIPAQAGSYVSPPTIRDYLVECSNNKCSLADPHGRKAILRAIEGNEYALGRPFHPGSIATFHSNRGWVEMRLRNAHTSLSLPKRDIRVNNREEVLGKYANKDGNNYVELAKINSKVALVVPGVGTYFVKPHRDCFELSGFDSTCALFRLADDTRHIGALEIRLGDTSSKFYKLSGPNGEISVSKLQQKVINAIGGTLSLLKHTSMALDTESEVIGEKVQTSCRKLIGRDGYNSITCKSVLACGPSRNINAINEQLANRLDEPLNEELHWHQIYKRVYMEPSRWIGEKDCYVVLKIKSDGSEIRDFYAKDDFTLVRRERWEAISPGSDPVVSSSDFSDYRLEDGVKLPHIIEESYSYTSWKRRSKIIGVEWDVPLPQ